MSNARHHLLPLVLLCAACGRAPDAERKPEPPADPVDANTRVCFAGDVILAGRLAHETTGAIVLTVRPNAGQVAYLQRSYDVADPWRSRNGIGFGLSAADGAIDPLPTFGREMELVVRFDADGNPATHEKGDVEVVTHVRTGATDIQVTLGRDDTDLSAAEVEEK